MPVHTASALPARACTHTHTHTNIKHTHTYFGVSPCNTQCILSTTQNIFSLRLLRVERVVPTVGTVFLKIRHRKVGDTLLNFISYYQTVEHLEEENLVLLTAAFVGYVNTLYTEKTELAKTCFNIWFTIKIILKHTEIATI